MNAEVERKIHNKDGIDRGLECKRVADATSQEEVGGECSGSQCY